MHNESGDDDDDDDDEKRDEMTVTGTHHPTWRRTAVVYREFIPETR